MMMMMLILRMSVLAYQVICIDAKDDGEDGDDDDDDGDFSLIFTRAIEN